MGARRQVHFDIVLLHDERRQIDLDIAKPKTASGATRPANTRRRLARLRANSSATPKGLVTLTRREAA